MPSCSAWCTSSARAGISSRPRRYTTVTSAPRRLAVRAASMATLPPPTTTHFLPAYTGVSYSGNWYAFKMCIRDRYKTKVIDRKLRAVDETIRTEPVPTKDLDQLMEELAADEEVVRVKEIEFEPLTEEEALVKICLLYTSRCV